MTLPINKTIQGHALDVLRTFPDSSIDCVVTSPPYWGLRDYGIPGVEWPDGWVGSLGLEPDPWLFIDHMILIFDEIRRVLKKTGTAWVNFGDCYANDGKWGGATGGKHASALHGDKVGLGRGKRKTGLPAKNLVGIPWRFAFAMQDAGWILRQDIIWAKPNPMPESVCDRFTKSHEYLFLFSKAERYFFDQEAVKEPSKDTRSCIKMPDGWDTGFGAHGAFHRNGREKGKTSWRGSFFDNHRRGGHSEPGYVGSMTRNRRTVWNIATQPTKDCHFATFPEKLIEPCILAGCPERVCSSCGHPLVRNLSRGLVPTKKAAKTFVVDQRDESADKNDQGSNRQKDGHKPGHISQNTTLGWLPTCKCADNHTAGIVLDPFMGSGTTGRVAYRLRRDYVGVEMNPKYMAIELKIPKERMLFTL